MTKQCEFCDKEFETEYETKRFCSANCRVNNSVVNKYGPEKMLKVIVNEININYIGEVNDEIFRLPRQTMVQEVIVFLGLHEKIHYECDRDAQRYVLVKD